ncbi:unnamed protein product, partial [Didymodactylos carnosus]
MAGYARFPRPLMTDRVGPRFNTAQQVYPQRNGQRNFPEDRRMDNRPVLTNSSVGTPVSSTPTSQPSTPTQQTSNSKNQSTPHVNPTDVSTKITTPPKANTTLTATAKPDVVPPASSTSITLDSQTPTNSTNDELKSNTATTNSEPQTPVGTNQNATSQIQQPPVMHHIHQQHTPLPQQQQRGPKRPRPPNEYQQTSTYNQGGSAVIGSSSFEQDDNKTTSNSSAQQVGDKKAVTGGRCRLFIGNVPSDLTQNEFQVLFGKYGELVEYFVNPSRGFGFIKLSSRSIAEQAKLDLDGYILRGKPLRIRFASQGATVKVKNFSMSVSNELLKEAFEIFGPVERAVVIVDDRGKSTGEGIIEFEKKPSAQKCLNDCTEHCFFLTSELKPVIVEPWDTKDEEDGLPEKSLIKNALYMKERELKPRFADINSIESTIGLKWKELELQEKQLYEEVKKRMQYATEQVQIEIDQMLLEHQSQLLREG